MYPVTLIFNRNDRYSSLVEDYIQTYDAEEVEGQERILRSLFLPRHYVGNTPPRKIEVTIKEIF